MHACMYMYVCRPPFVLLASYARREERKLWESVALSSAILKWRLVGDPQPSEDTHSKQTGNLS